MADFLAPSDKEARARKRLDEQFAMFRSKHSNENNAEKPATDDSASVSHATQTTHEMPQAAPAFAQPVRKAEPPSPFDGIMEEAVFWQCVFGADIILPVAELVRRTRYCAEKFGVIKLQLPQYHSDRVQDTLATNLINRATHDRLLAETWRTNLHPVVYSHSHEYMLWHDQKRLTPNTSSTE